MSVDVVTVVQQPTPVVTVQQTPVQVISVVQQGPQGPQGPSGASGSGYVIQQAAAASIWTLTNPLGRLPNVQLYIGGRVSFADITSTSTTVTVTFPSPQTGYVVLS